MENYYVDEPYGNEGEFKYLNPKGDRNEIVHSLHSDYYGLYKADLTNNEIKLCYTSETSLRELENSEQNVCYDDWIHAFSEQLVHEKDREIFCRKLVSKNCRKYLETDGILSVNFRWKTEGGVYDYVQLRMSRTERVNNNFHVYLGIFDIAEETKKEFLQIDYLQEILEVRSKQIDVHGLSTARMAHEIRLLLNDIVTAEMVIRLHSNEIDRVVRCLDIINMQSEHIRDIIQKVLYISQLESGRIVCEEEPVNLEKIITEVYEKLVEDAGKRKQIVQIESDGITHDTVMCDYRRVYHLFEEILDNSLKYTPDDGTIIITVRESYCREHIAGYEFSIKDNGIGIDEECMEHLFEPFYRSERAEETKIPGIGLGMAVVHTILKILDGEVVVESEPDRGTLVTVTLEFPVYVQRVDGSET